MKRQVEKSIERMGLDVQYKLLKMWLVVLVATVVNNEFRKE